MPLHKWTWKCSIEYCTNCGTKPTTHYTASHNGRVHIRKIHHSDKEPILIMIPEKAI